MARALPRPAPLFFTIAAASSEEVSGCVDNLSLHPHGAGWTSGRHARAAPHELMLRLDNNAVIKEVVVTAMAGKVPRRIEVAVSQDCLTDTSKILSGSNYIGLQFDEFGTMDFTDAKPATDKPTSRGPRRYVTGLATGSYVRLRIYEPLVPNTYQQVGITAVEVWGRAGSTIPADAKNILARVGMKKREADAPAFKASELVRVLAEVGVPMEALSTEVREEGQFGDELDGKSAELINDLHKVQAKFVEKQMVGMAQQISDAISTVMQIGAALRKLSNNLDDEMKILHSTAFFPQEKAEHDEKLKGVAGIQQQIADLEQQRLAIAQQDPQPEPKQEEQQQEPTDPKPEAREKTEEPAEKQKDETVPEPEAKEAAQEEAQPEADKSDPQLADEAQEVAAADQKEEEEEKDD